ncbi:MAG: hypothetical protein WBA83_16910 [Burkholderiaceae bacterium]
MTTEELKAAVAERFARDGVWLNVHLSVADITAKIEAHTQQKKGHRQSGRDFLAKFAGIQHEYGPARWVPPFRPLCAARHPRAAEIDAAQPPMFTPNGIGNGSESSLIWRR